MCGKAQAFPLLALLVSGGYAPNELIGA
jgi:hypothetical protein